MTIHHILVPVDFSADAEQALAYAIVMARACQADLTLLHVIHTLPVGVGVDEPVTTIPNRCLQELEDDVKQHLAAYRQQVQKVGLDAAGVIVHGTPSQSIIDVSRDLQADLIVMGTHGRTGLRHALLGGITEKVVRLAPCPVLVTRAAAFMDRFSYADVGTKNIPPSQ